MTPATEAAKVPLSAPQVAAKFEPAPAPPPAPKPEAAMPAPPPAPPEAAKPKTAAMPKPPPAPVPPPAPKPGAAVAPPPPPPAAGDYRLQLASLRSDEAARREWSRLKRLHTDLLGDLDLALIRVNIPGKGVYHRVRVGPLADAEAALSLCAKLALRKVGCLVAKP